MYKVKTFNFRHVKCGHQLTYNGVPLPTVDPIIYLYIVVSDPAKRIVKFRVNRFKVLHGELFVQHPLVERHGEAGVDELAMVKSL